MLVPGRDPSLGPGEDRERRIHAIPLEAHELPEAVGVLVERVHANRGRLRDRLIEIRSHPFVVERTPEQREVAGRRKSCFLADTVDDATAAAAPEDHGVWPLQCFDTIEVVQVAVVLDIVAHTIEKEVRGRIVASDDHLIAIVLALMGRDAWHVTDDVCEAGHELVLHQLLCHNRDRLRHVAL